MSWPSSIASPFFTWLFTFGCVSLFLSLPLLDLHLCVRHFLFVFQPLLNRPITFSLISHLRLAFSLALSLSLVSSLSCSLVFSLFFCLLFFLSFFLALTLSVVLTLSFSLCNFFLSFSFCRSFSVAFPFRLSVSLATHALIYFFRLLSLTGTTNWFLNSGVFSSTADKWRTSKMTSLSVFSHVLTIALSITVGQAILHVSFSLWTLRSARQCRDHAHIL